MTGTGGTARRLNFRVYIEGVNIPFTDASVSCASNQPSSASINLVPVHSAFKIRPRSHINIFYFDDLEESSEPAKQWKMLWEGEVVGLGYNYSPHGRSVRLDCLDVTNFWDTTPVYLLSYTSLRPPVYRGNLETGTNVEMGVTAGNEDGKPLVRFVKALRQDPFAKIIGNLFTTNIDKDGNRLKEKVDRTFDDGIRALVGEYADTLIYVKTHHERKKVTSKIVSVNDEQIKSIANPTFDSLYTSFYQENRRITFRQLLTKIQATAFYNLTYIPAPKFDSSFTETKGSRGSGRINQLIFKPNIYFAAPPKCNVIFPDQIANLSFNRQFLAEPTRTVVTSDSPLSLVSQGALPKGVFIGPSTLSALLESKATRKISELYGNTKIEHEQGEGTDGGAAKNFILLEEEIEKGVMSNDINIGYKEVSRFGDRGEWRKVLSVVADYIGAAKRFEPRTINIQTEFNPFIVPDFSGLAYTRASAFLFRVISVSHTFQATGSASTVVNGNMVRTVESDESLIEEPDAPVAMNKRYFAKVGISEDEESKDKLAVNATYQTLLGCDSIVTEEVFQKLQTEVLSFNESVAITNSAVPELDILDKSEVTEGALIHKSALSVFNSTGMKDANGRLISAEYDNKDDKYKFAKEFTRRSGVATIKDVFETHYSLKKVDSEDSSSNSVSEEYGGVDDRGSLFDYTSSSEFTFDNFNNEDAAIAQNKIIKSRGHAKEIAREMKIEITNSGGGVDGR